MVRIRRRWGDKRFFSSPKLQDLLIFQGSYLAVKRLRLGNYSAPSSSEFLRMSGATLHGAYGENFNLSLSAADFIRITKKNHV
jgi:hypothetical protein